MPPLYHSRSPRPFLTGACPRHALDAGDPSSAGGQETAFISLDAAAPSSSTFEAGDAFGLRWFTPTREVPLCGHATMAAAKVLFDAVGNGSAELKFATKSGELRVTRDGTL